MLLSKSWVLRSLVRFKVGWGGWMGWGVLCLLPSPSCRDLGWSSFPLVGRCGRGGRPSSVACPCCLSRALPVGVRPWLRCSVRGLCGVFVSVPCSAAGRARSSSRLSSAVSVSFPLFFSYYIIFK